MILVASVAMSAAMLSVYVAMLTRRFSSAPGWGDLHWFSVVGLSAAVFSACNVPIVLCRSEPVILLCSRLQVLAGLLHVAGWLRYSSAYLRLAPSRAERIVAAGLLVLGLLAQVPGAVYRDVIQYRPFAPFDVVYRDPEPSLLGDLVLAAMPAMFVLVAWRFGRAARRGVPHAATHLAAILVLLGLAGNDVLNATGLLATPYLLDLGYVLPVAVVGYMLTTRFAADASSLAEMRQRLEGLVGERTRELVDAHERLHRSEKLAALGQLAAGVAHEVSSPAGVVAANLAFLGRQLGEGAVPAEALDCVRESTAAVNRISAIARQLLDAGHIAATRTPLQRVSVAEVARSALSTARPRCPGHVALVQEIPEDLWAQGHEHLLHQVLVNLVVNGAQAVPADRQGRVEIRALGDAGRVTITVGDDGEGMAPEVLRRVFEPFFTTKPFGVGHGLGLAVSRGLIASLGGDLRLESLQGRGTRALVELPEAAGEG